MIELFNATQPWELLPYINRVTDGLFSPIILLIIWIAIYVALDQSPDRNAAAASWVTFFIAGIFFWLNMLNLMYFIILLIVLLVSAIAMHFSRTSID